MSNTPKTVNPMAIDGIRNRMSKMKAEKKSMLDNISNIHVKLQKGNTKTGVQCWTVSLLPIIDCCNCSECSRKCYDMRNDCIYTAVITDRARNSAIHEADPKRYWTEIKDQIKANFITQLRINVGGDLTDDDFGYIAKIAKEVPKCDFLFFTKNYKGINAFLDKHKFPKNVHPIISRWIGMECENRHNLPESHVLWKDGKTTAPEFGAYYCGGNCSACHYNGEGCWKLKKGEHVIFNAH